MLAISMLEAVRLNIASRKRHPRTTRRGIAFTLDGAEFVLNNESEASKLWKGI